MEVVDKLGSFHLESFNTLISIKLNLSTYFNLYRENPMQVDHKEVTNGSRNGETLYVCAYFRPDKDKKPIRSLAPIEVVVMDNSTTNISLSTRW